MLDISVHHVVKIELEKTERSGAAWVDLKITDRNGQVTEITCFGSGNAMPEVMQS